MYEFINPFLKVLQAIKKKPDEAYIKEIRQKADAVIQGLKATMLEKNVVRKRYEGLLKPSVNFLDEHSAYSMPLTRLEQGTQAIKEISKEGKVPDTAEYHRKVRAHFKPEGHSGAKYLGTAEFHKSSNYNKYVKAHQINSKEFNQRGNVDNPNHHEPTKDKPTDKEMGRFLDKIKDRT